ncbi:MAG: hypothetical protein PHS92_02540 [Candidatus Gracilibacteria bacterium]|nr:hypothetical protein [Candidatus Gracilibacteria bacterium]
MRKLIALLTLIGFIIASHIQFIHAMDMNEMHSHQDMVHIMKDSESLFCNSDPLKQNQNECYKEIIQDKGINSQSKSELKNDKKSSYPKYEMKNDMISCFFSKTYVNADFSDIFKSDSDYTRLIGIVKNLN